MRTEFLREEEYETKEAAEDAMPWAAVVKKVEGAWLGFASVDDYKTWVNQK